MQLQLGLWKEEIISPLWTHIVNSKTGTLSLICGQKQSGKTDMTLQAAYELSLQGSKVLYYSEQITEKKWMHELMRSMGYQKNNYFYPYTPDQMGGLEYLQSLSPQGFTRYIGALAKRIQPEYIFLDLEFNHIHYLHTLKHYFQPQNISVVQTRLVDNQIKATDPCITPYPHEHLIANNVIHLSYQSESYGEFFTYAQLVKGYDFDYQYIETFERGVTQYSSYHLMDWNEK